MPRPFAVFENANPVAGKVRDHHVPFPIQCQAQYRDLETHVHGRQPFMPDPARSPSWNRAAIWSISLGHCAESTVLVPSWRNYRSTELAGGPNRRRGLVRTSRKRDRASGAKRTSLISSKPGRRPMRHPPAGDGAVIKNTSQLAPGIGRRSRNMSNRCRRSRGRPRRRGEKDDDKS